MLMDRNICQRCIAVVGMPLRRLLFIPFLVVGVDARAGADDAHPHPAPWSFIAPRRPEAPRLDPSVGTINPIDNFVRARLAAEGIQPAAEANKTTLLRRVTFDLTGMPPTLAE